MGAGKMGSFFLDLLSFDHEMAVYEKTRLGCGLLTTAAGLRRWTR